MNLKRIKKIYFKSNCNTGGVARDYSFNINQIRIFEKAVEENELEWSKEFLKSRKKIIKKKKIENIKAIGSLIIDLWKFEAACKSYDDIYELSLLYFQILLDENKYSFDFFVPEVCDIYYCYYDIFLFNKDLYIDILDKFEEKTLLEYLKLNKPKQFLDTIEKIKIIASKDKYKDTYHKKILDLLKSYF